MAKKLTLEQKAKQLAAHLELLMLDEQADKLGPGEELELQLRRWMGWVLIILLASVNVAAFTLVYLAGFGVVTLPPSVLIAVIGATVADLTGIVIILANWLFPRRVSEPRQLS